MTTGDEGLDRKDERREWFYSVDGIQQTGPFEKEIIQQLILSEILTPKSFVWRKGFETWQPIESIPELYPIDLTLIDAPKNKETSDNQYSTRFHPWRRWSARMVDMNYFTFGVAIILLISSEFIHLDQIESILSSSDKFVVLIFSSWIFYEAFFLTFLGATPGKMLWGISVKNKLGDRMDFGTALRRSCYVLVSGIGLTMQYFLIFMCLRAYLRIHETGTTPWDDNLNLTVTYKKWGIIRAIVCTITFLLLPTLIIIGIFVESMDI